VEKVDGLEKIKQRIINDATFEAQKLIEEASAKASDIRSEQIQKADKLRLKLESEAKALAYDHKKRLIAAEELDLRKALLKTKRDILDSAFKETLGKIRNMPVSEYSDIIKEMLMSFNLPGEVEIIYSGADKDQFGSEFTEGMNVVLKAIGKDMRIKQSEHYGNFEGGFILKGTGVEINNTLETLTKLVRAEAEPIAAKVLFANSSNGEEGL